MKKNKKKNISKAEKIEVPQTRRSFVKNLWMVLGTIAGLEIFGISLNFLLHSTKNKNSDGETFIIAGNVKDFQIGTVTPFRSGKYYIARLNDGGFLAMSLKCTHLGCSVGWNENDNRFVCPCHSSSFDINGNVISPPAPSALDLLPLVIENGIVKVNPKKSIKRRRFSNSQVIYAES